MKNKNYSLLLATIFLPVAIYLNIKPSENNIFANITNETFRNIELSYGLAILTGWIASLHIKNVVSIRLKIKSQQTIQSVITQISLVLFLAISLTKEQFGTVGLLVSFIAYISFDKLLLLITFLTNFNRSKKSKDKGDNN